MSIIIEKFLTEPGNKIRDIERAVQLSEQIMRVLILNAEAMSMEDIEKQAVATGDQEQAQGAEAVEKATEKEKTEQVAVQQSHEDEGKEKAKE